MYLSQRRGKVWIVDARNLGAHLRKLEVAGYIDVDKTCFSLHRVELAQRAEARQQQRDEVEEEAVAAGDVDRHDRRAGQLDQPGDARQPGRVAHREGVGVVVQQGLAAGHAAAAGW